jgi:hypothetical protein
LKAVFLDDADDTTDADREPGLAKFLSEDVERGVGIKEAMTDDLANELVGADIVVFGAGLVALEPYASMFTIEFEQLKVSLFAEAELFGGFGGPEPFALAFDEHGQAGDDKVVRQNGDFSGGADDTAGGDVELHGVSSESLGQRSGIGSWRRREDSMASVFSLIDYGVLHSKIGLIGRISKDDNAINT